MFNHQALLSWQLKRKKNGNESIEHISGFLHWKKSFWSFLLSNDLDWTRDTSYTSICASFKRHIQQIGNKEKNHAVFVQ